MRNFQFRQMKKNNAAYIIAVLTILLVATSLRFYLLDSQSFWNDEGNSARLSERTFRLIIEGTASDIHPPLYYLLLRGWRELVGESEFSLRAMSAFADILTVSTTLVLARWLTGRRSAGLAAGIFMAVNPALIYYSQEARMYSLLGLLALVSTVLFLRLNVRFSTLSAIGYVMTSAAGLYTHYFFPVVLLVQGIVLVAQWVGGTRQTILKSGQQFGLLWLAVLLLYSPWLPIFLSQFSGEKIMRPNAWSFFEQSAHWLFVGQTLPTLSSLFLGLVLLLLLLVNIGGRYRHSWLLTLAVLLPISVNFGLGTTDTTFLKFYTIVVPFVAVLLGRLVLLPRGGRVAASLLMMGLLPFSWQSIQNLYSDPQFARADYRQMARTILDQNHPNAGIILDAPNQWEVFTYYYPDETAVYPLPKGRSQPSVAEIDASLTEISAQHERLYAIFWGEAQRDPERLVEKWLDSHAFKATDEWVGDVRFVTYAVPPNPAVAMETAVPDITFGEQIQLLGYTLNDIQFQPGDIVQVTLFWQAAAPIADRYKVFLHVVDENGTLQAQRDSEPGGGLALTSTWSAGETVIDNHGILLPAEMKNGRYRIQLGLYPFAQPENRLFVQSGSGSQDVFHLSEITIGR